MILLPSSFRAATTRTYGAKSAPEGNHQFNIADSFARRGDMAKRGPTLPRSGLAGALAKSIGNNSVTPQVGTITLHGGSFVRLKA